MYYDHAATYSWNEIRNGVAWLGRFIKRQAVKLWGWVQWIAWGRLHARMSIDAYETVARRRARGSA